jgi:hypothetical protein
MTKTSELFLKSLCESVSGPLPAGVVVTDAERARVCVEYVFESSGAPIAEALDVLRERFGAAVVEGASGEYGTQFKSRLAAVQGFLSGKPDPVLAARVAINQALEFGPLSKWTKRSEGALLEIAQRFGLESTLRAVVECSHPERENIVESCMFFLSGDKTAKRFGMSWDAQAENLPPLVKTASPRATA